MNDSEALPSSRSKISNADRGGGGSDSSAKNEVSADLNDLIVPAPFSFREEKVAHTHTNQLNRFVSFSSNTSGFLYIA